LDDHYCIYGNDRTALKRFDRAKDDDMMIEKSGVQKLKTSRRVSLGSSCVYVYVALSA